MHPNPRFRRLAVLIEGGSDIFRNKTAIGLLRFRPEDVVCVVDPARGGICATDLGASDARIPVVGSMAEAVLLGIDWVVVGVATPGGFLPQSMRAELYEAIRNRIGVISGLHDTVRDPNLVSMAARYAVDLVNLRKTDADLHTIGTGRARGTRARRVLTVGTDANIGKTTTSLCLHRHLLAQGVGSAFVPTGQDGILLSGHGLCIDRQIADFCSGAVEELVLEADRAEPAPQVLMIEGQNAIFSPCYSASAMALLHGGCPDAMILCHAPDRIRLRNTDVPVPTLTHAIELYQAMLMPLHPGKVVAISLNTLGMTPAAAAKAIAEASRQTGLPCADPVREGEAGCARLSAAIAPFIRPAVAPARPRRARR